MLQLDNLKVCAQRYISHVSRKSVVQAYAVSEDSVFQVYADSEDKISKKRPYNLISAYFVDAFYLAILLGNSECHVQTASSLSTFNKNTFSHGTVHMFQWTCIFVKHAQKLLNTN